MNQDISVPAQAVDALHKAFGKHKARAVHAKGIILEGTFTPAESAAQLTTAAHLQKISTSVTVRVSDFTGIPDISDVDEHASPRGLAIKFHLPDSTTTDIIAMSFNGFPVATFEEFNDLLLAMAASDDEAEEPTEMDKFLSAHPIAETFLTTQKPAPVSYATINYFGVNSFKFTNKEGESQFIRYQFLPEEGEHFLTEEQVAEADPDYLQKEIAERVAKQSIKYKLFAQVAEPGDKIEDPSIAWPDSRKLVLLGTIEIQKMTPNTTSEDKALSFNPGNIPTGIATADPMLDLRSKAYPISVKERQ